MNKREKAIWVGLALLAFPLIATALGTAGLTYHGRLLKPNGTPVVGTVHFLLQVRSPDASNCLLFQETKSVDLTESQGMFSLTLNDGTGTILTGSYPLDRVFANRGTFTVTHPNLECGGTNVYTPNMADGRVLKVYFNDGSFGDWEPLPAQAVNFVPSAIESIQVGGFRAEHLLRVQNGSGAPESVPALSSGNFTEFLALLNGTSSRYAKSGELLGSPLPTLSGGQGFRSDGVGGWQAYTPLTSESDPTVEGFAKTALPSCDPGEVLSSNGSSFACVPDMGGWSAVDAGTSQKGIVLLAADGGSTPGTVVQANDARLSAPRTPTGTAGGDLTGSYPNPLIAASAVTETKIADKAVAFSKIANGSATGQVLRYDAVSGWAPAKLGFMEIVNSHGVSPWPSGSCAAGEAIVWQSVADGFRCQSIAVTETDPTVKDFAKVDPNSADFSTLGHALTLNTVPIAKGGTGATTKEAALRGLLPDQTGEAGKVLQTDGTDASWVNAPATGITALTGEVTASGSGSVTATIANNAITSSKIANGQVTDIKIDKVSVSKIQSATSQYFTYQPNGNACTAGQILKWNNSRWECGADANGGGTITGVTATAPLGATGAASRNIAIANGSATGQMLRWNGSAWETSTVGTELTALNASNLGSGTIPAVRMPALTGDVTSAVNTTVTTLANSGVTAGTYGTATQVPRMTVDAKGRVTSVTNTTITGVSPLGAGLANGRVWVGNGSGAAAAVAVSGDATLASTGALTIAANAVTSAKIANGAVTSAKIVDGTIAAADLSAALANGLWTAASGNVYRSSGNVGIGTTSPRAKLDVSGVVLMREAISNGPGVIDFSQGNLQYTTSGCGSFAFHNLKNGGTYSFAIQGTTAATCAFTAFSNAGSTALTVHLPPDHGITMAGKHTLYTVLVMGTHAYFSWIPGM